MAQASLRSSEPTVRPDDGGAERRCIVTGAVRPRGELLRFVLAPDGTVVYDLERTLPGRGLWLSPRRDVLEKACRRNLFAKAARASATVASDLPHSVERALCRHCLDLVGLARRAGQAVAGFEKARAWLAAGRADLLLQASDAAPGGRQKLSTLGRTVGPDLEVVALFSAEELGRAMGRESAVHVVLAPGGLARRLSGELALLSAFLGADGTGGQKDVSA